MTEDLPGKVVADPGNRLQFLGALPADTGDASESREQGFFPRGRDAGNPVQETFRDTAPQQEFVVAVGGAVCLVTDPLQQAESTGVLVEAEGLRLSGTVDFLELLGQSDDLHSVQAQGPEFPAGHAQLPLASVHDDQIGQGAGGKAAGNRLAGILLVSDNPGSADPASLRSRP